MSDETIATTKFQCGCEITRPYFNAPTLDKIIPCAKHNSDPKIQDAMEKLAREVIFKAY